MRKTFGWMREELFRMDSLHNNVWGKWLNIIEKNCFVEGDTYPTITISDIGDSTTYKRLEKCIQTISIEGRHLSDFVDWIGYAIGIAWCSEEPKLSKRSQEALEELFPWEGLISKPADYLSRFLAENGQSGVLDYYPTPTSVTRAINAMLQLDSPRAVTDSVIEPCLGAGGMILSTNSLNITGMDMNITMVKAACIQAFFYKPQMLFVPGPILGVHVHPIEQRVHKYFEFNVDSRIYCGNSLIGEFKAPRRIFQQDSEMVDIYVMSKRQRNRSIYKYRNDLKLDWQTLSKSLRFDIVKAMAREHQFDVIMTNPPFNMKVSKYEKDILNEIEEDNDLFLSEIHSEEIPNPQLKPEQLLLF